MAWWGLATGKSSYRRGRRLDKGAGNAWDSDDSVYGTVYKDTNGYHFWYSGGSCNGDPECPVSQGIGYASSSDGISWTKDGDNPIFHISDAGADHRSKRTYTPSVIDDGSGFLKMYYSAVSGDGDYAIGLAVLPYDFVFAGFFQPIDNGATNIAKAGQIVPVKWRITGSNGVGISVPSSFVSLTSKGSIAACGEGSSDAIEEYAGTSGLLYLRDGYWQFNWKTPKDYAGQCRTMKLLLADGTVHTADFQFK